MQNNKLNRGKSLAIASITVVASCLAAGTARAGYTYTTLANFDATTAGPNGGLVLSGGTLYGTTLDGGDGFGTVFSVPATGGAVSTLVIFDGTAGETPRAGLVVSGNTLYGTTQTSTTGSMGGTVFSIPTTGGSPTTLATLDGLINTGLTLSGSTLYGTTSSGGSAGHGSLFSVPVSGGSATTVSSFTNPSQVPNTGATLSGNSFYVAATMGSGSSISADIVSIPVTGGSPTTLGTIVYGATGEADAITQPVVLGNTLYASTYNVGLSSSIISLPVTGGSFTTLATVDSSLGYPTTNLVLSGNTLYGTTSAGGTYGDGVIFSIPVNGNAITVLGSVNGTTPTALTISGNTLYGTTRRGGVNNDGTVFSLSPNAILSLSASAPTAFGAPLGSLNLTGSNGNYTTGSATFPATPTGYLAVSGFNPSTDDEVYALELTDSDPDNLAADLADAASEINAGSYSGYSVTASTTDPLTILGDGYDFYITITEPTLGTGSPYFGFDFTQLNGTTDTLGATAAAAVPEPTSLSLIGIASLSLLCRRRRRV